jgi:hypothetical protein
MPKHVGDIMSTINCLQHPWILFDFFHRFLVHPYTCCSDRHASTYWTFIARWISMGFHPLTTLFFSGACCKWGGHLNTSTAPSCWVPASYCHLSANLQNTPIIVVNLQDNLAVFRIFIALLRFSFDCPSYNVYLCGLCAGVLWSRLLCFPAEYIHSETSTCCVRLSLNKMYFNVIPSPSRFSHIALSTCVATILP